MPEKELWPEGPGSEPVTRIGSWDSMTSATSTRSGSTDSYDFLSAEEKECLLFLEETIGSLDAEADSGLSTEESEQASTPQSPRALPIIQPAPQGHPEETLSGHPEETLTGHPEETLTGHPEETLTGHPEETLTGHPEETFTGHPEETLVQRRLEPRRVAQSSSPPLPEPQGLGFRSGSYSLPRNIYIGRNQSLRKSTTQTNSHLPGKAERLTPDPEKEQVSQSSEPSQAPLGLQEAALDLDTALIPPPEAFRDSQPQQGGQDSLPQGPGEKTPTPQLPTPQLPTALSSQERKETSSEAMSQRANERGSAGAPRQPQAPPAMSQNGRAAEAPVPPGVGPSVQVAPLTMPKTRKLPPNIVLKSSRSSFHSDPPSWLSRHAEAAPGDPGLVSSSLQEQRKARQEALEKLGLPQDQEKPSPHLSKPTSSFRLKGAGSQASSPAPGPAPAQPVAQASAARPAAGRASAPAPAWGPSPVKALAPALTQGSTPGKVFIPAQEPTPGKIPAAKSMPIPIPVAPRVHSPLTLQESSIPGLRQMNFKSNTLERSGVGLSSYLSAEKDPSSKTSISLGKDSLNKISPNVLRNSRPRPASLGTGKDFAGIRVSKLAEQEQGARHLSYQGQSRDKLPRPTCVSVKITPKGIPDEHRREALKKLGLLKE